MDRKVKRYYQLKQQQKEIERELAELRSDIMSYCAEQGVSELAAGGYRVKLVSQERKEYDDSKLYEAIPDPDVWRLMSKPDSSKIASLIQLNVISEQSIQHAYSVKSVTLLQVEKK